MKNPKSSGPSGKAPAVSYKGPSSSAAAADRHSLWESDEKKPIDYPTAASGGGGGGPFNHLNASPAGPSAAPPPHLLPHERQIHPHPFDPPPPPPYGFHNLDRRTVVLADGSVRSYFALPPDYSMESTIERFLPPLARPGPGPGLGLGPGPEPPFDDFRDRPPFPRGPAQHDYWSSLDLDGPRGPPDGARLPLKRKYGDDDDDLARHRQHVLQYGNPNGMPAGPGGERPFRGRSGSTPRRGRSASPPHPEHRDDLRPAKQPKLGGEAKQPKLGGEGLDEPQPPSRGSRAVEDAARAGPDSDQKAVSRAFLKFAKMINENASTRKNYLEDGKNEPLKCIVCDRNSKEFTDVHALLMHAYNTQKAELRIDHLGLHKALCVLMGWNYAKAPKNSKEYRELSDDDVSANRDDLIIWPPTVIIHNTNSERGEDGRMKGMSNKEMHVKLKEWGFSGFKAKSLYGKDGHLGISLVKFPDNQVGLKDAELLADFFEKDSHGRNGWARAQAAQTDSDEEKNPELVKVDEKTGDKKRIFYGYLATASDFDKVDPDIRKTAVIKSRRESD